MSLPALPPSLTSEAVCWDCLADIVPHHGGTDPLIAIKVLEHCGIPKAEVCCNQSVVAAAGDRRLRAVCSFAASFSPEK
jgi:hypothetical protein